MTPTKHAQLPAGWVWVTFGGLLSEPLANGLSIKGSETPPGVPALKLNAMGERGFDWSKVRYLPIDWDEVIDLEIQEGDFFISRGNGSLALVGRGTSAQKPAQSVIFPDTMIRARICEPIRSTGWVQTVWSCPGVREQIERRVKTTAGIWKISQREIESIRLPLPPLAEQTRIVGEVEKQLTRLDAGVEALKRVQTQLKRYRASALKAACEGRLVPTEAELARREKRDYEPADKLLARILKERRARWEADQLAKMKASGKPPKDDKWKAKYVEPAGPQISDLGVLPEGWQWATVEQLALLVTDGDHNPPKRALSGVPHLTAKHIKGWGISTAECTFVSPADFEKTRARYEPTAGDLIVTCVGTVGETAIVPDGLIFSADRNLAGIRVVPQGVSVRFLQLALGTPQTLSLLRTVSGSTAQPHLYLGDLRAIVIPVPPTAEQLRILEEADRLLSLYRANAGQVQANLARSGRLRQAVLRRAFEGLLVPQDPRDEPASKLLERISAAMENKPLPKQGRAKQATAVPKMKKATR